MSDTTCLNCFRILKGKQVGNRKFCNDNCYYHHTYLMNEIKKANILVERERNRWKTKTLDMYRMFYEIIWSLKSCDLCGNKLNDQIHMKFKPGVNLQDIDGDSFITICDSCYFKINKMKDNSNSER